MIYQKNMNENLENKVEAALGVIAGAGITALACTNPNIMPYMAVGGVIGLGIAKIAHPYYEWDDIMPLNKSEVIATIAGIAGAGVVGLALDKAVGVGNLDKINSYSFSGIVASVSSFALTILSDTVAKLIDIDNLEKREGLSRRVIGYGLLSSALILGGASIGQSNSEITSARTVVSPEEGIAKRIELENGRVLYESDKKGEYITLNEIKIRETKAAESRMAKELEQKLKGYRK